MGKETEGTKAGCKTLTLTAGYPLSDFSPAESVCVHLPSQLGHKVTLPVQ